SPIKWFKRKLLPVPAAPVKKTLFPASISSWANFCWSFSSLNGDLIRFSLRSFWFGPGNEQLSPLPSFVFSSSDKFTSGELSLSKLKLLVNSSPDSYTENRSQNFSQKLRKKCSHGENNLAEDNVYPLKENVKYEDENGELLRTQQVFENVGLQITDASYAEWLRDVKKIYERWDLNYGGNKKMQKELREEYELYLREI
ncbi:3156_t:CDS:2, partial [Racocetra persica]